MPFIDEARQRIREMIPDYQEQLADYVPRVLIRDDVRAERARLLMHWRAPPESGDNELVQDIAIGHLPNAVLVGNAGSGKSQVLTRAFLARCERFLSGEAEPFPFFLDLGSQLAADLNLERALTGWSRGLFPRVPAEHSVGAVLFLDSLDEVLLKAGGNAFYNDLRFFLEQLPPCVNTIIACRRPFWYPDRLAGLARDFAVFDCDNLDPEVYERLIPQDAERGAFFAAVRERGIESLLDSPFFGFDLARSHLRGGPLPTSRNQWFDQQLDRLLAGTAVDQERSDYIPVTRLASIARHIACLESFSRVGAWTPSKALDILRESTILTQTQPVQRTELEVLFQRPLFRKTGDEFSFVHQLFRERLAATALREVPLRKQRQLLEAPIAGPRRRILMPRRGIAIDLADISSSFRSYLIENDPLVAFLSEMTDLPIEEDERLAKRAIDICVAEHRAPWWEVPPRGERPEHRLPRHRPRDKALFIEAYLLNPDEIARMWATAACAEWGGVPELNGTLIALAHDTGQHTEIRRRAIEAVTASGAVDDTRQLYDLLESADDIVHGAALGAYRVTERPVPRDFIARLTIPPHNVDLLCMLEIEPELYAQSLDVAQLQEAFAETDSHYSEIGAFLSHLLRGLTRRALEFDYRDIPVTLVLKIWRGGSHYEIYFEKELDAIVRNNPTLFARLWEHLLQRSADPDYRYPLVEIEPHLLNYCTDLILDLVPPEANLNESQKRFVEDILAGYFYRTPTPERLQLLRNRAAPYASRLRIPKVEPSPTRVLTSDQISIILREETGNAQHRTRRLLGAILESRPPNAGVHSPSEIITAFLQQLPDSLRLEALGLFEQREREAHYIRTMDENGLTAITPPQALTPFWVLCDFGYLSSAEKKAEIIQCYGLIYSPDRERLSWLLDELEIQDHALWEQCLTTLAELHRGSPHEFLSYLVQRNLDTYVAECRARLVNGDFGVSSYDALLDYWVGRRPPDCAEVLRQNYLHLRQSQQEPLSQAPDSSTARQGLQLSPWSDMRPLLFLVGEDVDWAWQELHERIQREDVPWNDYDFHTPFYREVRFPPNPSRLPVLADWYAFIRRHSGEDRIEALGQLLLESIIHIDGEEAIAELQRLIREQAFPGAEWLSHSIIRIQDRQLQTAEQSMLPREMLDFVNREPLGVVQNSRDLFEWTCQAIEEIKDGIELRAEQVIGYWDKVSRARWRPKHEVPCQTVFWPTLRAKLQHLGITAVEERRIAANSADFWVEKVIGQPNAQVIIELKTARKGYGEAELIDRLRDQLWERYLRPTSSKYGIFVVLWFKDRDRYPFPSHWNTKAEYECALEAARLQLVAEHNLSLACYVVDMTTMPRLH